MGKSTVLSLQILLLMQLGMQAHAADTVTTQDEDGQVNVLPTIEVTSTPDDDSKAYAATKASSVLRSDAPLFETAQSISVISEKQGA